MKKEFPFDNLYEVMLQYLAPLYFPQSLDDDTIHTLAREEFFRVRGIISGSTNLMKTNTLKKTMAFHLSTKFLMT